MDVSRELVAVMQLKWIDLGCGVELVAFWHLMNVKGGM
ncbi:MAG: hypothetical protein K0R67_1340 [Paenibacillus sp.]|jgi:hypothetical protein|nr:hypothetical protein [Paenibacillus sp.]